MNHLPASRRNFLALGGTAAAGFAMVEDAISAERIPGNTVADRSSSIRITGYKAWWVNPVLYIRIDDGISRGDFP